MDVKDALHCIRRSVMSGSEPGEIDRFLTAP